MVVISGHGPVTAETNLTPHEGMAQQPKHPPGTRNVPSPEEGNEGQSNISRMVQLPPGTHFQTDRTIPTGTLPEDPM